MGTCHKCIDTDAWWCMAQQLLLLGHARCTDCSSCVMQADLHGALQGHYRVWQGRVVSQLLTCCLRAIC